MARHLSFLDIVCATWSTLFLASPIRIVICKLKALKLDLKVWNKDAFCNFNHNIEDILASFIDIQKWYDEDSFFK